MTVQKIRWLLFLMLLCTPLLWLAVKDNHDWSDDGEGYILQTKNICEGKPKSATGYVYNPRYIFMGPPVYTVGFPLLLTPVHKFFGLNIYAYMLTMSVLLIFFISTLFIFLSSRMKSLYAFLFCVMLAYNPATLGMKAEIMCDILSALFLLLSIICYERWKEKSSLFYPLLLALINGALLSIKGTGVVMSAALIGMLLISFFQQRSMLKSFVLRNTLLMIGGGGAVYFLLNRLLLPPVDGGVSFFISIVKIAFTADTISGNLDNCINQFLYFFIPEMEKWTGVAKLTAVVLLSFTACGFVLKTRKQVGLSDIVFVLYGFLLLLYPYQSGLRFIFPLMPFAFYYIYLTAHELATNFKHKQLIAICIASIILLQYRTIIERVMDTNTPIANGPQRPSAQEAFEYIKKHTPKNALFDFRRPRAMALYAERKTCCNFPWAKPIEVLKNIDSLQVNYCVTNTGDINPGLDSLIKIKPDYFTSVWSNDQFVVYKFR